VGSDATSVRRHDPESRAAGHGPTQGLRERKELVSRRSIAAGQFDQVEGSPDPVLGHVLRAHLATTNFPDIDVDGVLQVEAAAEHGARAEALR
jgi:hypothetical protein